MEPFQSGASRMVSIPSRKTSLLELSRDCEAPQRKVSLPDFVPWICPSRALGALGALGARVNLHQIYFMSCLASAEMKEKRKGRAEALMS